MRDRWTLRLKPIVAVLLCFAMVLTFDGCKKEDPSVDKTSMTIADVDDAITQLAEAEADYGYENALSELTEKSSSTINGDSYYRLQQNYQGIPVYGRTVVCATDDSGHITSITGNPVDINLNIDSTPSITSDQVQDSISSYVADILGYAFAESVNIGELSEKDLCFYTMSESEKVNLAYCVAFGGYEFIVDAATGEVLLAVATIQDVMVPGYKASDTEMDNPFNVEKHSETEYVLEDNENNIIVMDLNGIPSSENNDTVWNLNKANRVVSTDNIFGNDPVTESAHEDGATLLQTFTKMHEFFSVKLEVNKQSETGTFVLYYRDGYQNGRNARGGCDDENNGILLMGSEFGMTDLDVIAHEYTHIITKANVNWTNATIENYALNEAYSDIFGELVETWYNNQAKPNWRIDADFISRILRDVQTPSATGNAVSAEGIPDELGLTKDEIRSYGYEYSTVISHAAYLMWNGIDETDSKRISTDELAELWYRAMLMMPSDCSFSDCRQLVELAATSMELTTAQIECVSEAFDAVGITGTTKESFNALYELELNSTLSVYGGDGELYDNYTLNIAGKTTIYGPVIEKVDGSYNRTKTITSAEPYELNLPQGIYVFTITDNANPSATSEFTVCVQNNDGDANIDIFTNFGCTPVKGTVSEIKEVNDVDTNVPVTNAVVKVYSHAQESVVETIRMSETEGFFEVYLPVGNYSFAVEAEGYISSTTSFELTPDEAAYLSIFLEREKEKRLTRMDQTDDDGNVSTTTFTYNDKGLLISTTHTSEYDTSTYTYVYDEADRLIEVWSSFWGDYGPQIKYHYDANGYLVEICGIGEGGGVGGVYENDDLGRPVRYTTGGDFYSSVTEFTYSSDGRTISTVESSTDYYGDVSVEYVTYTYTYDAEGRMLSENRAGADYSYLHVYSYDYKPFVTKADEEELPYHYSINDIMGHEIWSIQIGIPETVETDDDGFITRIVYIDHDPTVINGRTYRNDATYEFFYDDKADDEQKQSQESDTVGNGDMHLVGGGD